MNEIAKKFFALSEGVKKKVHISMAEPSLNNWKSFVENGEVPLSYRESVVGTVQVVDPELPERALEAIKSQSSGEKIAKDYQEPICSMQDEDWVFNDDAQMAYYAIYNTFSKYVEHKEIDDWVIVNQALSSLGQGADIFTPLKQAVEQC